jgi:hypothetical protein
MIPNWFLSHDWVTIMMNIHFLIGTVSSKQRIVWHYKLTFLQQYEELNKHLSVHSFIYDWDTKVLFLKNYNETK